MERDPQLTKLIRDGGVVPAPEGFSNAVMEMIVAEPEKKAYKPLIGRGGRIIIILFMIAVVVLSVIFTEPGGRVIESAGISNLDWQMPEFNLNWRFISDLKISTGLVAGIVAIFILVLSDAGLSRRKFVL
jgi:hypothetical protein